MFIKIFLKIRKTEGNKEKMQGNFPKGSKENALSIAKKNRYHLENKGV